MARTTLALLLASRAAALVPSLRSAAVATPKTVTQVSYLSEVEDADKKKKWWDQDQDGREESNPRDHTGVGEADSNYGPTNYEGFIDADGFDGGDGQVGVVGDGKNHMEEFDMSAEDSKGLKGGRKLNQMGGRESKLNAKNAWGTTTGYADELAKRGMVEIDEYGEDKLARRRQQLENWRNQEELRMKKDHQMAELASLQGKEYRHFNHGSYLQQFDNGPKDEVSSEQVSGMIAGDLTDTVAVSARLNARGGATITVRNEFSTYADFTAGFTSGSSSAVTVEPTHGTLNRRAGDPQEFVIKFQPTDYADSYDATLVIETEDMKQTYEIIGKLL